VADAREVEPAEVADDVPWAVLLSARSAKGSRPKLADEGTRLYEFDAAELTVTGLKTEPEWTLDGVAQGRTSLYRVPLKQPAGSGSAAPRLSVRMTAQDLVQEFCLPRLLAVCRLSLELPAVPAWLLLLAQRARNFIPPLHFKPAVLPSAATSEGFLTTVLLDADTFMAFVTEGAGRTDGARMLAAEEAVMRAIAAAPAQSAPAIASSWTAAKVATSRSGFRSRAMYDAAVASLREVATVLPDTSRSAVLSAATALENRALKFPHPVTERDEVQTAIKILRRAIQARETLVIRMPGVHHGF
jgi:hypothetical protein